VEACGFLLPFFLARLRGPCPWATILRVFVQSARLGFLVKIKIYVGASDKSGFDLLVQLVDPRT